MQRPAASCHAAGTCGRGITRVILSWTAHRRRRCTPCRVTNTSEEIYKQLKLPQPLGDDEGDIIVNDTQVLYPELGSLESRVTAQYLDELLSNKGPDLEETAYWFHTPDEGWKQEPSRMQAAPEVPVTFANPSHEFWEQEGRTPLSELEEGQVIKGEITDVWLYHGCQVDFGFEFDGLVPLMEGDWMEAGVREALMPGDVVTAKVYKIRQPGLYRWPIQLELIEPAEMAPMVMDPASYEAPISHDWAAEQGWGIKEIVEATERDFEPSNYLMPQDDADRAREIQQMYGFDVENENPDDKPNHMEQRVAFDYTQQISQLAAQQDDMTE